MSWIAEALTSFVGELLMWLGHDIGQRHAEEASANQQTDDRDELILVYPEEPSRIGEDEQQP